MTGQRDSFVQTEWAGEVRTFRLRLGELRALQEATGFGPQALLRRLYDGEWHVDDLRETLRQGLMGGGMPMADVDSLLKINFDDKPMADHIFHAQASLQAVLVGVVNDPVGDAAGEGDAAPKKPKPKAKKPTAGSRSARSTTTRRSSASPRDKSTS